MFALSVDLIQLDTIEKTMSDDGHGDYDPKQARLERPSGWMELTRYETVRFIIDALLEASPEHKFNKSELERRSGVTREAIRDHIPFLIDLGVIEEVEDEGWPEYRLNSDSKVTRELQELNSAVNSVLAGESKNITSTATSAEYVVDNNQSKIVLGHDKANEIPDRNEHLPDNSNSGIDSDTGDDDLIGGPPRGIGA